MKKMKVWNLSKVGGWVKPQIQTFLVFILEVLTYKSGDGLGRLIPIFGKLCQQKVWTKSILLFFIFFDELPTAFSQHQRNCKTKTTAENLMLGNSAFILHRTPRHADAEDDGDQEFDN